MQTLFQQLSYILQKKTTHQFILYIIIGTSGASLDYTVFFILFNYLSVPAAIASIISMPVGIINNFFWNRQFNFKIKDKLWQRFGSFLSIGAVGILISTGYIYVAHDLFGLEGNITKLSSIVLIAIIQFFLNKYITFKVSNTDLPEQMKGKDEVF